MKPSRYIVPLWLALGCSLPPAPGAHAVDAGVDAPSVDAPSVDAPSVDAPSVDAPSLDVQVERDVQADEVVVVDRPDVQSPPTCNEGFLDCDGNAANGCEVDTRTSVAHCGACQVRCVGANATSACVGGACRVTACTGTFGNCDDNAANGCESDLLTSAAHCGACGVACTNGRTCQLGRCAREFSGYTVNTDPPSDVQWIEACTLPNRQLHLMGGDNGWIVGTVPFSVEFWGGLSTDYLVSTNGEVGFGRHFLGRGMVPSESTLRSFGPLPIASTEPVRGMMPAAYVLGLDLVQRDGVCVATTGSAPNRRWIAQTQAATATALSGTSFSFELIVYESLPGVVDFLYNAPWSTSGSTLTSSDVTVGLQDFRQPVRAVTVPTSVTLQPGTRIRFLPIN